MLASNEASRAVGLKPKVGVQLGYIGERITNSGATRTVGWRKKKVEAHLGRIGRKLTRREDTRTVRLQDTECCGPAGAKESPKADKQQVYESPGVSRCRGCGVTTPYRWNADKKRSHEGRIVN